MMGEKYQNNQLMKDFYEIDRVQLIFSQCIGNFFLKKQILIFATTVTLHLSAIAQQTMEFEKYEPISTLVVPEHIITKAKFPFVDVHSHQFNMGNRDLSELVGPMDKMNMKVMVNLSGISGEYLRNAILNIKKNYPDRFIVFANINFDGIGEPGWTEQAVKNLRQDYANGAKGLKIFENLGVRVRDNTGARVRVNDKRLDPLWAICGELGIPVLIHTAAPRSFWDPVDEKNERWLELKLYPDRIRSDTDHAPWQQLINEQHDVFRKHPNTVFIAAHLDWHGGHLERLGKFLDSIPNMYTEFGAVIAELGRQPRMARWFFEKYQDRILFGKDSWIPEEYATYFRVLETEDEYFPYHKKYHAFWQMYGLGLSDEILKKVYYKNALKIFPQINPALFPK